MNQQDSKTLRVDEAGRYILDLQTPAEKTLGRALGCFSIFILFPSLIMLFEILGDGAGFLSKLLRIVGLLFILFAFNYFRKSVDCYYVLDEVGGQLLYHFSAAMVVSEDPVANIENIIGVGATYAGSSGYAVVICCDDERVVRVSDFIPMHEANSICEQIVGLIDVPVIYAVAGKRSTIAIENAMMAETNEQSLVSQATVDKTSGCLGCLLLAPYLFSPAFLVFYVALMVFTGSSEERDLGYYLKNNKKYRAIDANGQPVKFQHKAVSTEQPKASGTIDLERDAVGAASSANESGVRLPLPGREDE